MHLQLGGRPLVDITLDNGSPSSTLYLHTELLGSPRRTTGSAGQSVYREHYAPHREKLNNVNFRIGYTGHVNDQDTGLVYAQARYYDPLVGRFLSIDPVGFTDDPFSFNRYGYANNNPYSFTDPNGTQVCAAPTGTRICPDPPTTGKPQVTKTEGHDTASENLAEKHVLEARSEGRTVNQVTFNSEVGKATNGDISGRERLDSLVESTDSSGSKHYALGEVISPSQTRSSQEKKLLDIAERAKDGVYVSTEARKFMKGSGRLLGPLGSLIILHDLLADPDYHADQAAADFFNIPGAQ